MSRVVQQEKKWTFSLRFKFCQFFRRRRRNRDSQSSEKRRECKAKSATISRKRDDFRCLRQNSILFRIGVPSFGCVVIGFVFGGAGVCFAPLRHGKIGKKNCVEIDRSRPRTLAYRPSPEKEGVVKVHARINNGTKIDSQWIFFLWMCDLIFWEIIWTDRMQFLSGSVTVMHKTRKGSNWW